MFPHPKSYWFFLSAYALQECIVINQRIYVLHLVKLSMLKIFSSSLINQLFHLLHHFHHSGLSSFQFIWDVQNFPLSKISWKGTPHFQSNIIMILWLKLQWHGHFLFSIDQLTFNLLAFKMAAFQVWFHQEDSLSGYSLSAWIRMMKP